MTDTARDTARDPAPDPASGGTHLNAVQLVGRVSADPEERELPSGDTLVTLRLVVDRPPRGGAATQETRRQVDVIDVACWSGRVRRTAAALHAGDLVRVEGALRRRFYAAAGGRASRYEVEAGRVVRQGRRTRATSQAP